MKRRAMSDKDDSTAPKDNLPIDGEDDDEEKAQTWAVVRLQTSPVMPVLGEVERV
jgi:hypothetical protein